MCLVLKKHMVQELAEMKRVARLTLVWHGDAGGVPGPSGLGRVGLWCLGFSFCRPQSFGS